jgi:ABC-2 type transport system ATP-binding protein
MQLWDVIGGLHEQGTTIVLTTQYMEEADQLADRISVIDGGRIIAEGTADELKARVGGDVVHLTLCERTDTGRAVETLATAFEVAHGELVVDPDLGTVQVPVGEGSVALVEAVRALDTSRIAVADLGLRRPSLDDVFLSLTGHIADEPRPDAPMPRTRRPVRD